MIQDFVIDIAEWPDDEEFSGAYPEGARPKRTIFSPTEGAPEYIKPDWRYMFKRSSGRYVEQFWAEIIAYRIALLLDVPAPPVYAAIDTESGYCGALSEWFYQEGVSSFFAAGNFFHKLVADFDRQRGTQHNLQTAHSFNSTVFGDNYIYEFWSMMLFDAVIGNTDRHQDNWGHLIKAVPLPKSVARRKGQKYKHVWSFAPWFDNGTSLGHELLPGKFTKWNDEALDRYIRRGQHHIRFALDRLERVGHVESMRFIDEYNKLVRSLLVKKIKAFDVAAFDMILRDCVALEMPFGGSLTQERADFIFRLTLRRIQLAMEALHGNH